MKSNQRHDQICYTKAAAVKSPLAQLPEAMHLIPNISD